MTEGERPPLRLRELAARPVTDLRLVGPKVAERLEVMGIVTVLDLLTHYPRRYHDRRATTDIGALEPGEEATVYGTVVRSAGRRTRQGRSLVEVTVDDGTSKLRCTFFNQAWRERQLRLGTEVAFFGRVDLYNGQRQMTNPVVDVVAEPGEPGAQTGVLVPLYPASGKADLHTGALRAFVASALERCRPRGFADPLDDATRAGLGLVDRTTALRDIHVPGSLEAVHAATARLTFDEFLRMQVGLVARKRALEREGGGIRHAVDGPLVPAFYAQLPFPLTTGQSTAIADILRDLVAPAPMHRLLQGEVGSGKTVVALTTLLVAVQGGHQGAFMAPTEVLAEQHFVTMRAMLGALTLPDAGNLLGERPLRVELHPREEAAAEDREGADGEDREEQHLNRGRTGNPKRGQDADKQRGHAEEDHVEAASRGHFRDHEEKANHDPVPPEQRHKGQYKHLTRVWLVSITFPWPDRQLVSAWRTGLGTLPAHEATVGRSCPRRIGSLRRRATAP